MKATLIYLDRGVLLSRRRYNSWQEIQAEYWNDYKTSLSPMSCQELLDFFAEDCGEEANWPFSKDEILAFFTHGPETIRFAGDDCEAK